MKTTDAASALNTTRRLQADWHKVVGLLMAKMALQHVVITVEDIRRMPQDQCLLAEEMADGLHIQLVDSNLVPLLVAQAEGSLQ